MFAGLSPLTRERWEYYETKPNYWLSHLHLILVSKWFCFNKFEEMNSEMEESKELADNRLIELQKLQQDLQNVHQENSSMKVFLPMYFTAVILNQSEYIGEF